MTFNAQLAGTVESFDGLSFTKRLAALLKVDLAQIFLTVTSGSVKVTAQIRVPDILTSLSVMSMLQNQTAARLSQNLGMAVEQIELPTTKIVALEVFPPPVYPPPLPLSPPPLRPPPLFPAPNSPPPQCLMFTMCLFGLPPPITTITVILILAIALCCSLSWLAHKRCQLTEEALRLQKISIAASRIQASARGLLARRKASQRRVKLDYEKQEQKEARILTYVHRLQHAARGLLDRRQLNATLEIARARVAVIRWRRHIKRRQRATIRLQRSVRGFIMRRRIQIVLREASARVLQQRFLEWHTKNGIQAEARYSRVRATWIKLTRRARRSRRLALRFRALVDAAMHTADSESPQVDSFASVLGASLEGVTPSSIWKAVTGGNFWHRRSSEVVKHLALCRLRLALRVKHSAFLHSPPIVRAETCSPTCQAVRNLLRARETSGCNEHMPLPNGPGAASAQREEGSPLPSSAASSPINRCLWPPSGEYRSTKPVPTPVLPQLPLQKLPLHFDIGLPAAVRLPPPSSATRAPLDSPFGGCRSGRVLSRSTSELSARQHSCREGSNSNNQLNASGTSKHVQADMPSCSTCTASSQTTCGINTNSVGRDPNAIIFIRQSASLDDTEAEATTCEPHGRQQRASSMKLVDGELQPGQKQSAFDADSARQDPSRMQKVSEVGSGCCGSTRRHLSSARPSAKVPHLDFDMACPSAPIKSRPPSARGPMSARHNELQLSSSSRGPTSDRGSPNERFRSRLSLPNSDRSSPKVQHLIPLFDMHALRTAAFGRQPLSLSARRPASARMLRARSLANGRLQPIYAADQSQPPPRPASSRMPEDRLRVHV